MELTFHPYTHPPAPVMTEAERRAWDEPVPAPMTMEQRAAFHGMSTDAYEQLVLREESHPSER